MGSGSLHDESLSGDDAKVYPEMDDFSSYDLKFSKSSECYHHDSSKRCVTTKAGRRSDESKAYGGRMNHKFT